MTWSSVTTSAKILFPAQVPSKVPCGRALGCAISQLEETSVSEPHCSCPTTHDLPLEGCPRGCDAQDCLPAQELWVPRSLSLLPPLGPSSLPASPVWPQGGFQPGGPTAELCTEPPPLRTSHSPLWCCPAARSPVTPPAIGSSLRVWSPAMGGPGPTGQNQPLTTACPVPGAGSVPPPARSGCWQTRPRAAGLALSQGPPSPRGGLSARTAAPTPGSQPRALCPCIFQPLPVNVFSFVVLCHFFLLRRD